MKVIKEIYLLKSSKINKFRMKLKVRKIRVLQILNRLATKNNNNKL